SSATGCVARWAIPPAPQALAAGHFLPGDAGRSRQCLAGQRDLCSIIERSVAGGWLAARRPNLAQRCSFCTGARRGGASAAILGNGADHSTLAAVMFQPPMCLRSCCQLACLGIALAISAARGHACAQQGHRSWAVEWTAGE